MNKTMNNYFYLKDRMLKFWMVIYSIVMLFYSLLPSMLIMEISFLFFMYAFITLKKYYNNIDTFIIMSVIAIPTSTISVLGTSYSGLPLTWFNLLVLLTVVLIGVEGKIDKKYFFCVALFMAIECIQVLLSINIFNAVKQCLMIVLFLLGFIITEYLKNYSAISIHCKILEYYIIGTLCMGIQIFLQRFYILATGIQVGHYAVMAGRTAYAGTMGDYSFATLYLASGCLIILLEYLNTQKCKFATMVIGEVVLLASMIIVSARTGLVTLVITVALYFLFDLQKINWKHLILIVVGALNLPYIIEKMMAGRGGQTLLDSSGRIESYISALHFWTEKPIWGYGLGIENLKEQTGLGLPHNFIIQYLVQIGIIGLLLILFPIIIYAARTLKNAGFYKWLFWLLAIGAMFIPDIVSSRYLYGVLLICATASKLFQQTNDKETL